MKSRLYSACMWVLGALFGMGSAYGQNPYYPTASYLWQETTYDTAFVQVLYKMEFWNQWHSERYEDLRMLEIGMNYRKDYSLRLDILDRKTKECTERFETPMFRLDSAVYPFEWFVGKNNSWSTFRTIYGGPILRWPEKTPDFTWQLLDEADTVAGFLCQKAKTFHGGRIYEAYYCSDIPVSAGPYIFGGLPGLILKIQDTASLYKWEIAGMQHGKYPIAEKQFLFQKSNKKKATEVISFMFAHPFKFLVEVLHMDLMIQDGKGGAYSPGEREFGISWFYEPIEIE
ncbi:MAG: GLPGLI family protein [Bacteroides sp.]|nr:GLPGLI family protein [Ruminococcus flavefaciens]MCM1555393.1 GLPGLI family protein [Bacteroides sp.]